MKHQLASPSWGEEEKEALLRVIKSGQFTMGEEVRAFEVAFAEYVGSRFAVMVNSGSSANLLMVAAMFHVKDGFEKNDEVIVPAVSWSTTYFPLCQHGLRTRLVDIDIETLNADPEKIEDAINSRTKAILAVNLLGNPNNFNEIQYLCKKHDLVLLEDNCEALGSEYDGRQTSTFGRMGTFSFFFSHHISTMEGGMIVTDDEELYHILLSLRSHGWTRHLPEKNTLCEKNNDPFLESFRFILPGYNLRPLELSGAVGREQIKKYPEFLKIRRENAEIFQHVMKNNEQIQIQKEIGTSSWFGFSLVIRPGASMTRDHLRVRLGELGFETRPIVAGNMARSDAYKFLTPQKESFPNADYIHDNGLFIGNHHYPIHEALNSLPLVMENYS
jgi:CDP-6-deoxy-D-xylo-4-hexulose-3-dehydrase